MASSGSGDGEESRERERTKASLKAWWNAFTKVKIPNVNVKKEKPPEETRVFGIPLRKSLKYASVAISMAGPDGKQYVWGFVPVIVAKIGLYLKENAVEVEGVFRIAGSQKRMRELQETFDSPPRYGKDVDWSKYSVHDAASVLRRYLNMMPEPIIPLHLYNEFRNIMQKKPFDVNSAIKTYRLLIKSSPPANQYLLLYVLDLLAVFSRESAKNLMTASNLSVIFQPGMFSHPVHLNSVVEHRTAVSVLEFLIEHQDHFVLGLSRPPPANVSPADLTIASQPTRPDEVYFEPSDSDEDLGVLEAHEGGGAVLAQRSSSAQGQAPRVGRHSGGGGSKRRLFRKGRATDMQPSASAQTSAEARAENAKLTGQVIGLHRTASPLAVSEPSTSPAAAAQGSQAPALPLFSGLDDGAAEVPASQTEAADVPLSGAVASVRRSKTIPSRRPDTGTSSPGGPSRRRNSNEGVSPSGSGLPTPLTSPKLEQSGQSSTLPQAEAKASETAEETDRPIDAETETT